MRHWFYTVAGKQKGPVPETEFARLFETAELTPDTLVWSEGLDAWTPARKIKGFVPSAFNPPPTPPPLPPNAIRLDSSVNAAPLSGPQVRPWVRYWARMIDFFIFCLLAGILLEFVYPPALEFPDGLFGSLLFFVYNFVEPAMFATWGTTPGKALLRVHVRNADGSNLSYYDSLSRVFKVWFRGEGIGIPIVALFTQINAYNKLTKEGKTSWDQDGNFTVIHQSIEAWRVALIVLFFIGVGFLMALGQADI